MSAHRTLEWAMSKAKDRVRFRDLEPFLGKDLIERVEAGREFAEARKRGMKEGKLPAGQVLPAFMILKDYIDKHDPELARRVHDILASERNLEAVMNDLIIELLGFGVGIPSRYDNDIEAVVPSNKFRVNGVSFFVTCSEEANSYMDGMVGGMTTPLVPGSSKISVKLKLFPVIKRALDLIQLAAANELLLVLSYAQRPRSLENLGYFIKAVKTRKEIEELIEEKEPETAFLDVVNLILKSFAIHEAAHVQMGLARIGSDSGRITVAKEEIFAYLFDIVYNGSWFSFSNLPMEERGDGNPNRSAGKWIMEAMLGKIDLPTINAIMELNLARFSEIAHEILDRRCVEEFGKHEDEIFAGKEIAGIFEGGFRFLGQKRIPLLGALITEGAFRPLA